MAKKKLEESLDIEPVVDVIEDKDITPKKPIEIKVHDDVRANMRNAEQNADYSDVRSNLKNIIDNGMVAIDGILSVASEGDSPRAYEVVSQLIKSVSEANKELMNLHQQMQELEESSGTGKQNASSITNNSIFVGSTKDLQELVKNNFKQMEDKSSE